MSEYLEDNNVTCIADEYNSSKWCYQDKIVDLSKFSITANIEEINQHFSRLQNIDNDICHIEDMYSDFFSYNKECDISKILNLDESSLTEKGILLQIPDCVEEVAIKGKNDGKPLELKGNIFASSNIVLSVADADGISIKDSIYHNIRLLNLNSGWEDCYKDPESFKPDPKLSDMENFKNKMQLKYNYKNKRYACFVIADILGLKTDIFKNINEVSIKAKDVKLRAGISDTLDKIVIDAKGDVEVGRLNIKQASIKGESLEIWGDINLDEINV